MSRAAQFAPEHCHSPSHTVLSKLLLHVPLSDCPRRPALRKATQSLAPDARPLVAIVELRAAREARINLTVTVTLIGSAARRLSNYLGRGLIKPRNKMPAVEG